MPNDHGQQNKVSRSEPAIFSLNSGLEFAASVAEHLGVDPAHHEERDFEDGEHKIRPLESMRGRDVYVIESLYSDDELSVNDKLVRLLFLINALRDSTPARINLITPYLAYARKDRRTKAYDPVTTRYLAQLFETAGVDLVVAIEVHNVAAFENAFRCSSVTLNAEALFAEHFLKTLPPDRLCVASPDAGGVKRAESFRETLQSQVEPEISSALLQKKRSSGVVSGQAEVAGDVRDRDVILLDDLIATGTTLARAAGALRDQGARSVTAAATHGIFSSESDSILATELLDAIVITNSVHSNRITTPELLDKLTVLDLTPLVAAVIRRLHDGASVIDLVEHE